MIRSLAAAAVSMLVLGSCGTLAEATTSPSVTATAGASRPLPAGFFGVNFDYATVAQFKGDAGMDGQLAQLDPGTIRYPGGTSADSFDWMTGQPMKVVNGFQFTLDKLETAWEATGPTTPQTRAVPIFDINMSRSVSDQIQMLQKAQSLGMPIRYVELGNELYSKKTFADGTAYGVAVAAAVKALHAQFPADPTHGVPRVQVAADAWLGHLQGSATPVENSWNKEMLMSASQHGALPDAMILHAYPPPPSGDLTQSNLPQEFVNAYREENLLQTVIGGFPASAPPAVWLTEYNIHAGTGKLTNPPQKTYAHALFVGEDALLAQETPTAKLSNFFTAFGGPDFGAWEGTSSSPYLSPQGLAFQWVAEAAHGATTTTPIDFSGGPTLPDGKPALVGSTFSSSGGATRAVLVNLTGGKVMVSSGSTLPAGAPYQNVSGDPVAQVAKASQLTHGSGTVGSMITLPAYSITYIS